MRLLEIVDTAAKGTNERSRLTDDELLIAMTMLGNDPKDEYDIKELAKELSNHPEYDRSIGSAEFTLTRLHILLFGLAPYGITEHRAESMFSIPESMKQFAARLGYDADTNITRAKRELKDRPQRVSEEDAKQLMGNYYMAHKAELPKSIRDYRENIILDLMAGEPVEDVFAKYANAQE